MNEQKNLLLAIVVSLIILLIFQYLFPTERKMIEENVEAENQIKEVEDALSTLLKKKLKVTFKPSDLTETPFEFEKIRSHKESKQAEDDLKKDSSLNEMLEKFDGKIKKVSKI